MLFFLSLCSVLVYYEYTNANIDPLEVDMSLSKPTNQREEPPQGNGAWNEM